jgi:predicted ATPase with chaperone activity
MDRSKLIEVGGALVPAAPVGKRDTGVDPGVLSDLALRTSYLVPQFNTEWMAQQLHLVQSVAMELLDQLREELLLDVLGHAGPFGYRYSISSRGRERAKRLFEITSYVGPAPITLDAYSEMITRQVESFPAVTPEHVTACLDGLILHPNDRALAGLAASSGRSLFIFGPAGNGKTTLGRLLHTARQGELWIPHTIEVEGQFIRVFDPQCHQPVELDSEMGRRIDRRWVRIRRPMIVVGGEMTLDSCDLRFNPALRYHEAPLHMKANGGTFLIDDFGRQRVDPRELLNRWIIPLEHQFDHLTLHTGQMLHVPFLLMLIVATNLDVESVTDPAFLRRMGYRMYLDKPSTERYVQIFERYASQSGLTVPPALVQRLLDRYQAEQRELRGCEPRDLIERARDICRFRSARTELTEEILDLAWIGYFGNRPTAR